jgi:hypothetical protein
MEKKFRAADYLIRELVEYDKKRYSGEDSGSPEVTILVPDGKKLAGLNSKVWSPSS